MKEVHAVKYKLKDEKVTTINEGLVTQMNERTLEMVK